MVSMVFRRGELGGYGYNLELIWQRQPQAEGLVRPSVAWCFGVATATFWRLEGW